MTKGTANISTASSSSSTHVNGLLHATRAYWSDAAITYSMPTQASQYGAYPDDISQVDGVTVFNRLDDFQALSSAMANFMRAALDTAYGTSYDNALTVEGFTNLNLSENTASPGSAQLRGAVGTMDAGTAVGYYPTTSSNPDRQMQAGDLFFSNNSHTFNTVEHELGHTLGLRHTFEGGLTGIYDTAAYSVMSYDAYASQSWMVGDIAALQHYYGADYSTNAGNNTYSWSSTSSDTTIDGNIMLDGSSANNDVLMTIWDGGGTDTYNLSNYTTSVQIDLRPGGSVNLGSSQSVGSYSNVYNAFLFNGNTGSLIENANGGSAADTMWGNVANNVLSGNGGADAINGNAGEDTLYGNAGTDTLRGGGQTDILWGGGDADIFLVEGGGDRIKDWQDNIDDIGLSAFGWASEANCLAAATQANGHTTIWSNDGTRSVVVENFLKANLDVNDFYFAGAALPTEPAIFEL